MRYAREEVAWAAGFYEGEGTIYLSRTSPRMYVTQVNVEPLSRFREVLGVGTVRGPYQQKNPGSQPIYKYTVNGLEKVQAIIAMIWPWLSDRRRAQATKVLTVVSLTPLSWHYLLRQRLYREKAEAVARE